MKKNLLKKFTFFALIFSFLGNAHAAKYEKAILAGGCFWGMQELLSGLKGVVKTEVGYTGGSISYPVYALISTGVTGHAESVEVTFDPEQVSYEQLLKFYFTIHDPTTLNRQENDVGSQYRSEIFYFDDLQKNTAINVIAQANRSKVFKRPVVTRVSKAKTFYPAEGYHQDYLKKNPYGYTCHHVREEWKF